MFETIKKLFGITSTDYADLIKKGAVIVDVRTPQEYKSGHIKSAMNIPLQSLQNNLSKLKNKKTPVITCCASGSRSAMAKNILKNNGYTEVYNGGGWASLDRKINN